MPGHHEKGPKVPVTYLGVETSQVPDVVSEQLGLARSRIGYRYVEPNALPHRRDSSDDILKMVNDQILSKPSQCENSCRLSQTDRGDTHNLAQGKEQRTPPGR